MKTVTMLATALLVSLQAVTAHALDFSERFQAAIQATSSPTLVAQRWVDVPTGEHDPGRGVDFRWRVDSYVLGLGFHVNESPLAAALGPCGSACSELFETPYAQASLGYITGQSLIYVVGDVGSTPARSADGWLSGIKIDAPADWKVGLGVSRPLGNEAFIQAELWHGATTVDQCGGTCPNLFTNSATIESTGFTVRIAWWSWSKIKQFFWPKPPHSNYGGAR